jgi:predicted TPR repeat methyltransferase
MWGVDLSAGMIEKARAREVYDKLEVGDLVAALRAAEPASFDVLVAADVMVYIGDLSPTFELAARVLRPGGLLAFSVEAGTHERFFLHKQTMRYTHQREYVQHLAKIFGYQLERLDALTGRYESEKPVPNYLVVARWPGDRAAASGVAGQ